ncbi:hypothetical protein E4U33_006187, partial [Claviceps sp. LM78 group G4]
DVRTGKLDFLNLIRLHPSLGKRPSDDDGTSVVDIYDLRRNHCPQKKTHTLKGYPEPLVFLHCFQKYVWIYDQFYRKEHPEVPSAQLQFSIFITQQAEIFPWGKCRRYAMDRLSHIGISNIHDAKLWEERPPDWIHQHFSYVPLPVTQKRQRTNTVDASGDSSAISAQAATPLHHQTPQLAATLFQIPKDELPLPKPNTSPSFSLFDSTAQPLVNSPSPSVRSAWTCMLARYPGRLPEILDGNFRLLSDEDVEL